MCFAMGACFLVAKLITGLKKTTVRVYWPVVDALWDSDVWEHLWEGNGLGRGKST